MRVIKLLAAALLWLRMGGVALAQSGYAGTIGALPIELMLEGAASDSEQTGMHVYTKYDMPIELAGSLTRGGLTLMEHDGHGKATAVVTVPAFVAGRPSYVGTWKNLATGQQLPLALTRRFDLWDEPAPPRPVKLLQAASLPTAYFQAVLVKSAGGGLAVARVWLVAKKLVERPASECQ